MDRRAFFAFGGFLVFGAAMAAIAGATLTWPGSPFDRMWALNPRAYREMSPFGATAGLPLLGFAAILLAAAIGWFQRRRWAWRLALGIIAAQIAGDCVNVFMGRVLEGAFGVAIACALLWWLLRSGFYASPPPGA